jgi:hypothetical protein
MDRRELNALISLVDGVLRETWDPLGVNGRPEARYEYSGYATQVVRLLITSAPDQELEDYLAAVVAERMRLPPLDPARVQRTLAALKGLVVQPGQG